MAPSIKHQSVINLYQKEQINQDLIFNILTMKTWAAFAWVILLSNANATVNLPGEYEIEWICQFFKPYQKSI